MNTERLSHEEMEALLPDYAFGRCSTDDAQRFEASLQFYGDIQQELAQVTALFSKMQTMTFHEDIDYHTRNLSVRVNEALHKPTRSSAFIWMRRLAPVMLVAGAVVLFVINRPIKVDSDQSFDDELAGLLTKDSSAFVLSQNTTDDSALPVALVAHDFSPGTISAAQDGDQIEGLMAETIVRASSTDVDSLSTDEQQNEALDLMNSVDIQDIEQQIQEVENGNG